MEQQPDAIRILIVDDSAPIRERLGRMLAESPGVGEVRAAAAAEEAMALFSDFDPDAAVIDIHMPGKNGVELLRWCKERKPGLFTVILSNHPNEEYRIAAERAGCDRFFHKATEFERAALAVRQRFGIPELEQGGQRNDTA